MEKKKREIPKPTYFGKNLKFLRKHHNLSQTTLAEQLNLSRNRIASYEAGKVEPNAINLLKVCDFFLVKADMMLAVDIEVDNIAPIQHNNNHLPHLNHWIKQNEKEINKKYSELESILEGFKLRKKLEFKTEKDQQNKLQPLLDDIIMIYEKAIDLRKYIVPKD